MMNRLYLAVLLLLLFNGCNLLDKKEVKWNTFVKKGVFVIQYPDYLEKDSLLSPEATMGFVNKSREFYCMVLHETRDTFKSYGYDSMNLNEYLNLVKQNRLLDSSLKLKILSEKKAKVNGLNAIEIMIENDLTAENFGIRTICQMKQVVIEGKKGFFQVYVWGLTKDYKKNKKDFDKIISSFREL